MHAKPLTDLDISVHQAVLVQVLQAAQHAPGKGHEAVWSHWEARVGPVGIPGVDGIMVPLTPAEITAAVAAQPAANSVRSEL